MSSNGAIESIPALGVQTQMRRRMLWSVALFGSLTAGAIVLLLVADGPRIDRERFDCIQRGMTRAEVIALLGAPPGDYTFRKDPGAFYSNNIVTGAVISLGWTRDEWIGDGGRIKVTLDREGKVILASFYETGACPDRTAWERVQRFLSRTFPPF
jgi:hypothetical protein